MDGGFILDFEYKGEKFELETKFVRLGYIHQFHVNLKGIPLIIEFDEERDYRIINGSGENSFPFEEGLLQAIVDKVSFFH